METWCLFLTPIMVTKPNEKDPNHFKNFERTDPKEGEIPHFTKLTSFLYLFLFYRVTYRKFLF